MLFIHVIRYCPEARKGEYTSAELHANILNLPIGGNMSENAAIVAAKTKKSPKRILIIALSAMVLLLVYGAGFILLPVTILTNVRDRDCSAVLSWNKIYISLYPRFIQDGTLAAPAGECVAYLSAASQEENGMWQEAYDAYQGYSITYPGGMYSKEAHEHAARMLMNIVEDQIEAEKYGDVITNLNRIVSEYSDTSPSAEAWTLFPTAYTSWGTELREAGSFDVSERIFHDFETWIQTNQKTDLQVEAQRGLAQTFLAWGLNLQSQKQYEDALVKFDQAMAVDQQAQFDTTPQAKSGQRKVYVEWGKELLAQNQYDEAVAKFQLAASHAEGKNDDGAADALANGHIQWAQDLSTNEDFLAALEHLKTARETALSDDMKKSVEAAFGETYLAFSKSTGSQARRAMKDALKTVCEKQKVPDLPIFGLNKGSIRAGFYELEDPALKDLVASTPGEIHYMVCLDVEKRTIDSSLFGIEITTPDGKWGVIRVPQYRVKILWNIGLRKTDTGKEVEAQTFEGGAPPPFPDKLRELGNGIFEGTPPDIHVVLKWLQSVIR